MTSSIERKTGGLRPRRAGPLGRVTPVGLALCLAGALIAAPTAFAGKAYKWVDENGNVTYQDTPPPDGAARVEETRIQEAAAAGDEAGLSMDRAAARSPVTLYMIPDCAPCDAARTYLNAHQVPFTEKNVEDDGEAQAEMKKEVGALTVPTLVVGEKVMKGYVQSLLHGELIAAGYPVDQTAGGAGREAEGGAEAGTAPGDEATAAADESGGY